MLPADYEPLQQSLASSTYSTPSRTRASSGVVLFSEDAPTHPVFEKVERASIYNGSIAHAAKFGNENEFRANLILHEVGSGGCDLI